MMERRKFLSLSTRILLSGGAIVGGSSAQAAELRRPRRSTRRGLSQDLEFNLQSLHNAGYLSQQKLNAILNAYRDGSFDPDVELGKDWSGINYWVDVSGNVHTRTNGPGGKYYAKKDRLPLIVDVVPTDYGTFLFRNSCRNLMVGPPPPVEEAPPPEKETPPPPTGRLKICKKVEAVDGAAGSTLAGHQFELKGLNGYEEMLETDEKGYAELDEIPLGAYFLTEVEREHYTPKERMPIRVSFNRSTLEREIIVINRYAPPVEAPPPTGRIRICKKVRGYDRLDGFEFKVTFPNGSTKLYETDEKGLIELDDLELGTYLVRERVPSDFTLVDPRENLKSIELSSRQLTGEAIFINEYSPPKKDVPVTPERRRERRVTRESVVRQGNELANTRQGSDVSRDSEGGGFIAFGGKGHRCNSRCNHGGGGGGSKFTFRPGRIIPRTKPGQRSISPGTGDLPDGY